MCVFLERHNGSGQTSDDDDFNDNISVYSLGSEVRSTDGEPEENDEAAQQEAHEEKFMEALDGITQKSQQGRTASFEALGKALIKKYTPEFVSDRRVTVCDGIERGLKKGRGAEQAAAANLASLLCVQIGSMDVSAEIYSVLKSALLSVANDAAAQSVARAKVSKCRSVKILVRPQCG